VYYPLRNDRYTLKYQFFDKYSCTFTSTEEGTQYGRIFKFINIHLIDIHGQLNRLDGKLHRVWTMGACRRRGNPGFCNPPNFLKKSKLEYRMSCRKYYYQQLKLFLKNIPPCSILWSDM
jgi:hypothetical protein